MPVQGNKVLGGIASIVKAEHDYDIRYQSGELAKLTILNNHVFRFYMSPTGKFLEYPVPRNAGDDAKINIKRVSDYSNKAFQASVLEESNEQYTVTTRKLKISFDKINGTFSVYNTITKKSVLKEMQPLSYNAQNTTQILHQHEDEYFFGGGMQNGRFTHKGEAIEIINSNNWSNGGVTSPCPFYWSTYGYGVLRNTWSQGTYDFGRKNPDRTETSHSEDYFDGFYFINRMPRDLFKDYYELTGKPILMPEFAFYEAHLGMFNRDYWVEVTSSTDNAIQFEDGKYYKQYEAKDLINKSGTLESLNGENNNYQFSARAMINRYRKYDMPLGWFVPNDGYGSGYGQTDSFNGDLENLKKFIDYAHGHNVEVGLWNNSCLAPKDPKNPKKGERDVVKEVGIGNVAVKCDVSWIGQGYSFGLNALEYTTKLFTQQALKSVRPFIITVDGWAGTQRYAGVWSGNQCGGQWDNIRFHIPTYIGASLSGIPVVGSDMDGIFGGGQKEINIRDYQWKTFTPIQLGMNEWGSKPKTPFSYDIEAQDINRAYLKLKSAFLPYNYTLAYKSINGLPMVRAMFLEFPNEPLAMTKVSQYQYMWGPRILVAPVYEKVLSNGVQVRNGIYLPDTKQIWIDLIDGKRYCGGKIYNNIETPLWKIPVFVKDGAIIPMTNNNNNPYEVKKDCRIFQIYPNGKTTIKLYEDDGKSSEYLDNQYARTKITVIGPASNTIGDITIKINKTTGTYKNMVKERTTLFRIMATDEPTSINVAVNGQNLQIGKADTKEVFENSENVYYFDQKFLVNSYFEKLSGSTNIFQHCFLIKIAKVNVAETEIDVKIIDFRNIGKVIGVSSILKPPKNFTVISKLVSSISLQWEEAKQATYYEVEKDGIIHSNILGNTFTLSDLKHSTDYSFRVRSVNKDEVSEWSKMIVIKDPLKNIVKDVTATCNIPHQNAAEISLLTSLDNVDENKIWHTKWDMPGEADSAKNKVITLTFDLKGEYNINQVQYTPRKNGDNGRFLRVQYKYSTDGNNWSELSTTINWSNNSDTKTIQLNGVKLRYFHINVIDAVGGFGSGKRVLFVKEDRLENIVKDVTATCNIPHQNAAEISLLTSLDNVDENKIWHTKWDMPGEADSAKNKVITLTFDLKREYNINQVQYSPRKNGDNGRFLRVQYKYSTDSNNWSELSDIINWSNNSDTKTIQLNGVKLRYFHINVIDAVGGFGSGKRVLFVKEDRLENIVKDVTATCNIPHQNAAEISLLTSLDNVDENKIWHTKWDMPGEADSAKNKVITLTFDLKREYNINQVQYSPRKNGDNGRFLRVQYKYSTDSNNWSELSDIINWSNNSDTKVIQLNGVKLRYFHINVIDAVGGFGSGKRVTFVKEDRLENIVKDVTATCNIPHQNAAEISLLTSLDNVDENKIWHTKWDMPGEADSAKNKVITLTFDLKGEYNISQLQYTPRKNGDNGRFLRVQYKYSANGNNWSELSTIINWSNNNETKTLYLNGVKFRYFHLNIIDAVGGFGSGKRVTFVKEDPMENVAVICNIPNSDAEISLVADPDAFILIDER